MPGYFLNQQYICSWQNWSRLITNIVW